MSWEAAFSGLAGFFLNCPYRLKPRSCRVTWCLVMDIFFGNSGNTLTQWDNWTSSTALYEITTSNNEKNTKETDLHTPLHLFVVLSRMAFVDTILPYLQRRNRKIGIVTRNMNQTQPVIKHSRRVEQQSMTSLQKYEKQEVVFMWCWKPQHVCKTLISNSPLFL